MLCTENGTDAAIAAVSGLGILSSQTPLQGWKREETLCWQVQNHLLKLCILILDEALDASDGSVLLQLIFKIKNH